MFTLIKSKFSFKINAKTITFDGFPDFEFIIHNAFSTEQWIVSEKSTGRMIPNTKRSTQKEAVANAKEQLNSFGIEKFKEALSKSEVINKPLAKEEVKEPKKPATPTNIADKVAKDFIDSANEIDNMFTSKPKNDASDKENILNFEMPVNDLWKSNEEKLSSSYPTLTMEQFNIESADIQQKLIDCA